MLDRYVSEPGVDLLIVLTCCICSAGEVRRLLPSDNCFIKVRVEPWPGPVFSYKLRYVVGFWLVEMAIATNQKPAIYRNL